MSQPEEPTPGAPVEPETVETPGAPPTEADNGLPDDPQALKAMIASLRKENGAARTTAKQRAAEEARTALMQEFAAKLGFVSDEPLDPEKLTHQLTQAQLDAASAQLEHDVYRRAVKRGGPELAERLLDSMSFRARVDAIDDDTDFGTALDALIQAEAAKQPQARPGRPVESLTPGSMPSVPEPSLAEQIGQAEKAGDWATARRLKAHQLMQLQRNTR